jgi:hypothetical protein
MRNRLLPLLLVTALLRAEAGAGDEAANPAGDDPFATEAWDDWGEDPATARFSGFLEAAAGLRLQDDPLVDESATLGEVRGRIEGAWQPGGIDITAKADVGYDAVERDLIANFRELTAAFGAGDRTDVKLGRQVQTWGVGDLVFLNDLFPKDYVSFFAGREDEYLKAPGDSLRISHYSAALNADLVWTPRYEPDVYLTGERYSFFSPAAGGNVAPEPPLDAVLPAHEAGNGELALRLFKSLAGTEYALYFYRGFFKQPTALTADLEPTFAPMNAYGASLRRPLGRGLLSGEFAWYDSRDDGDGRDPSVPNSQLRVLAGYEWEARPNFTVGLQYYLEQTQDYDELLAFSATPGFEPDEYRHLLTNRLSYRWARETYALSLFTFWSPSDEDVYLRPSFTWRRDDHWQFAAGANLFGGSEPQTFFNQLRDASNAYLRVRYNY